MMVTLILLVLMNSVKTDDMHAKIRQTFPQTPPYEILKELIPILERGSVVIIQKEADKPPFITGIVLINARVTDVMNMIKDYERYHEFVPNIAKIRVLERRPDTNSQISEYNIGFDIALGLKFTITYTLEQTFLNEENIIFGVPARRGVQTLGDVRYIEKYYATGDGRTIMVYSAYADLSSFGLLAKLVYRSFPELQIPSLVAVSTLFPEAVKEKMEGIKLITEPKEVDHRKLRLPNRIDLRGIVLALRAYGNMIISWYPNQEGVRFFSSYLLLPRKSVEYVRGVVTDFRRWPKIFRMVEKAEPTEIQDGYKVALGLKYKIVFPIEIEYSMICRWEDDRQRMTCKIDDTSKKDIEGMQCAWDFYETRYGTVVGYTEFSDLRTGSYFLKVLLDRVQGFGIGLRVALVSAFADLIRKNI